MSSSAKAVAYEPQDQPSLVAPLGETPVARPGFRNAMIWMVSLSIPLWAAIVGTVYAIVRVLG